MNREDRERLVLHLAGELGEAESEALESELARDPELRRELEELRRAVELARLRLPLEPGGEYWRGFWARLQPRLRRRSWWRSALDAMPLERWLWPAAAFGTVAAALVIAVVVLHNLTVPQEPTPMIQTTTVRIGRTEGFFERAAGEHLQRSRLLLQDLVNVASNGEPPLEVLLDSRRRGGELLSDNRSLRLAAERRQDERLSGLLDELETVMLDIANLDPEVATDMLPAIRHRIERHDLLIKIEIVNLNDGRRELPATTEVL